jgi:N-acetylneuraminate synthase/N,N'-diacetyllegionaminate synthase
MNWSKTFNIANREVGEGSSVFIMAEAGVAHFGSLEKAFKLVNLAVEAGADAVKFQIFRTNELISSLSPEWRKRMQPKELSIKDFQEIREYCHTRGILFLATAHDEPSLSDLDDLDVSAYKIGSGEVKNWPFLARVAERGKPVILSTGMYTIDDISQALEAIAQTGNPELAVLHCVTAYPTPPTEVNLLAIKTIRETFDVVTGYSDHTVGYHFPLAAVTLGAKIIEKHITLDFDIPNAQDWKVSCGPETLHLMVSEIRQIEAGLGTGVKEPGSTEQKSLDWARKSLVAACDIFPGEILTSEKIKFKRPGIGIAPSEFDRVIGRTARVEIKTDSLILMEQLE